MITENSESAENIDTPVRLNPTNTTYQQQQTFKPVFAKDYQLDWIAGIGQYSILSGIQICSTQYLFSLGITGMFPVIIAFLPAACSIAATTTNITFNNKLIILDKHKLPIQLVRSIGLSMNASKILQDAANMDALANKSFQLIVQQEREYRNLPDPDKPNYFIPVTLLLILGIGIAMFKPKR